MNDDVPELDELSAAILRELAAAPGEAGMSLPRLGKHLGLKDRDWVDIHTAWSDGVERRADRFMLVAYDIPRGNLAAYYPETNPLVPLSSTAIEAGTPTSKSIPVILTAHEAAGSAQRVDSRFAGA